MRVGIHCSATLPRCLPTILLGGCTGLHRLLGDLLLADLLHRLLGDLVGDQLRHNRNDTPDWPNREHAGDLLSPNSQLAEVGGL
ncbi:hypothetical protein Mvan_2510 [Mycolicibacterium vanbaalenii PYR-1]|uniref:Uncharacterized protein n=1 Tax=Mycolicibacterium vanbaalenii (strain DSM 7251 / JCM 13017 / BCRC 16820 / KCTC 9966 / NRRL B-24157 / PYR-1) TaxID=350058 RepID=A1T821_MYCVP|nr:hypothetical protein Mvan_2510 [Mycolicibacterium vanbaalenii PYR-1]